MVGPRGWILVIGLLVFLSAGGECVLALIGDGCCKEDFDAYTGQIVKDYKAHIDNLQSKAFMAIFEVWLETGTVASKRHGYLQDLCEGDFAFKCELIKNSSKCVCNEDIRFVPDKDNQRCMTKELGGLCMAGSNKERCMVGTCAVDKGKICGMCKMGGVDNSGVDQFGRLVSTTVRPGPVVKTGSGGKGTASYTQRPIMWVIIGGLALIPAAFS